MNRTAIDLTQTLVAGIPDWDGCCGFQMKTIKDYSEGVRVQVIQTANGIGTHMDAPCHFIKDGLDIAGISLQQLVGPGIVINVSKKSNANYAISEADLIEFEQQYGVVPEGSIVIGYTGWGAHWHSPKQYRNPDSEGVMHFPKFSVEAISYLLNRNIAGIAIDTLSPDGSDYSFPAHHQLLAEGKFIIENIKINKNLPMKGFTIIALPIKIANATEAPCRVIALIK